jgi:molybdenum cofactor cytidylyltransferase
VKFGRLPLDEAEGAVLAHGLIAGGKRLKKGHRLTESDLQQLGQSGHRTVLSALLEQGDVDEDTAAGRLASNLQGTGTKAAAAFTGRCNIYAQHSGIVEISRSVIDHFNALDEGVTVATVSPFQIVDEGQMLATVKIIPFAVPEDLLASALELGAGAISVRSFSSRKIAVISTRLPETKAGVIAKGEELMRRRAVRTGGQVERAVTIDHHEDDMRDALRAAVDAGADIVVVFSASAITDRRDVVPAGLAMAGGEIIHYGMPVDPGNLLLLGRLGQTHVIGAPGCARSPKENGFDWVFQRLSAGMTVGPADIMQMGVGGLLTDTAQRGAPRDDRRETGQYMPRVAAILLAAGQSRRMGAVNKLLASVDGKPMVRHAMDTIRASAAHATIVVTGHEPDAVREVLEGDDTIFAHNGLYADGLSTSLGAGLLAVPSDCEAAVVCLGDMPRISPKVIDRLISAYNPVEGRAICVPTRNGKRGNPVLFDRQFFSEVLEIGGDVGARHLIGQHEDLVAEVPVDDDAIFLDVDTPEALERLR